MTYRILLFVLCAVFASALPALADQRYTISGNDRYEIGRHALQTTIRYIGSQTLSIRRTDGSRRFTARVRYVQLGESGKISGRATFVQKMSRTGELSDQTNHDPNYLTVLNQPFAIELDRRTMADLFHLSGRVPFDFPSPMGAGALHGYLARGAVARVAGRPVLAVDFDASGPMSGQLPGHETMSLGGTMRMQGTAYYALGGDALLLALDERMTISGTLNGDGGPSPVTILYQRAIKADDSAPSMTEANSK